MHVRRQASHHNDKQFYSAVLPIILIHIAIINFFEILFLRLDLSYFLLLSTLCQHNQAHWEFNERLLGTARKQFTNPNDCHLE